MRAESWRSRGNQVLALNVELRKKFDPPFYRRKLRRILRTMPVVAFSVIASMEFLNSERYTIFTGGRWMTLRLDFPFWVIKPLPHENELRFRWVFGFEQAF